MSVPRTELPEIRFADPADLPLLASIEAEGDALFAQRFDSPGWGAQTPGHLRAASPGFILVAGCPPLGLAHVLEEPQDADPRTGSGAHLELLVVRTVNSRRGLGAGLVEATCAEARRRGHTWLTLTTYADIEWNAPFYRRLGFEEVAAPTGILAGHLSAERHLERNGRRIGMRRRLTG